MRIRIHDELAPEDEVYTVIDAHLDGSNYILRFLFTIGQCIKVGTARISVEYKYKILRLFEEGYAQFLPNEVQIDRSV